MKSYRNGIAWSVCSLVATVVLSAMLAAPACAQIELSDDADWAVTPSSRYVTGKLGIRGTVKPDPDSSDLWDIAGRWAVATTGGDPETSIDDNSDLNWFGWMCPAMDFGYWKVKIGDTITMIGDSNSGRWTKIPVTYDTPPAGQGLGRSGGYTEAEWTITGQVTDTTGDTSTTTTADIATVNIRMSVVRDQIRFQLTLTNKATAPQTMGLQMHCLSQLGTSVSPCYPYIPGTGLSRQAASSGLMYPTILSGKSIPSSFEIFDKVDTPGLVARCSLNVQDCVAPDYLALGNYIDLCQLSARAPVGMWLPDDVNILYPLYPITSASWVTCWNPRTIYPGATRRIVTYYGMGAANMVWNYRVGARMLADSVALAVQGPRSLKYNSVNGTNYLDGQSFAIKAYVYNLATDPGPYDLDDVATTLYLPPGLELTSTTPEQAAQQSIGGVPVNSESEAVEWTVRATGEYSGELEYFVTASAASGWQQVVSRKVMVPATKKSVFRGGYQMMHVPFTFNNMAIEHAFQLPRGSFGAKYYDPATGQYMPVSQLTPGQAFWMYVGSVQSGKTQSFELAADAAIVGGADALGKQLDEYDIDVQPGWNLVGNPFVYPVYWGQVLVWNKVDNTTVSLDQAVTNGWLSKTIFTWIPESGTYDSFKDNDRYLLPWRGYWVRAKYPVTLVFRPSVPPGSDVTANTDGT